MQADAHFVCGAGHSLCEDWAAAGNTARGGWALIADGCSTAVRSDLGARLLGLASEQLLNDGAFAPALALERAALMADALGLERGCLDATLLCAETSDVDVSVTVCGDGVVAAQRRDGRLEYWAVSFADNLPAYPSYLLDASRLVYYLEHHGERVVEHALEGNAPLREVRHLGDADYVFRLSLPTSEYRLVALFSDGAQSFVDARRDRLPLEPVLAALTAYRGLRGRFVLRRTRRMLERARAAGWRPMDDLAVAALALEEAP